MKVALVVNAPRPLVAATSSVLHDVKKHMGNFFEEIIILHDGLKNKDKILLDSILSCSFIKFKLPLKYFSFINFKALFYFTPLIFSKFEILKISDDYDYVIFLDYDIVIVKEFSEIINFCKNGIAVLNTQVDAKNNFERAPENFYLKNEAVGAGIIILDRDMRRNQEMYSLCYEYILKYGLDVKLPEQAILDLVFEKLKIAPNRINSRIYAVHPDDFNNLQKQKIIHCYGQPKFWNGLKNNQWEVNYQKWIAMGGKPIYRTTKLRIYLRWVKYKILVFASLVIKYANSSFPRKGGKSKIND